MSCKYKTYDLTGDQITKIARLCAQEQGCLAGAMAEASLMANQLETDSERQKKYGTDGDGLYRWVRFGGWYYRAGYYMDYGSASDAIVSGVRGVLCDGMRTLPVYVDEHDCIADIVSISTGLADRPSDYIKGETIIQNCHGSKYTFWCFPAPSCDPFGYTEEAYRYAANHGLIDPDPDPDQGADAGGDDAPGDAVLISELPMLTIGSSGDAVRIWQGLTGADPDGVYGRKTAAAVKAWQRCQDITSDGIVGPASWRALFDRIRG